MVVIDKTPSEFACLTNFRCVTVPQLFWMVEGVD